MKGRESSDSAARAGTPGRLGGGQRLPDQRAVIRVAGESHGIVPMPYLLESELARRD